MAYKAHEIAEGNKVKRYWIVDKYTSPYQKKIKPNLTNNELMISFLHTKDCHLETTCINLLLGKKNINLSTYCEHLKEYSIKENNSFNQLLCNYKGNVEGKFYDVTWDASFMYPMLEMAGSNIKFMNYPLYWYNIGNPINGL